MKKYSRLMIIVMLTVIVEAVYPADLDINLPGEGKRSEAQMYFNQIPVEKRNSVIKYYLAEGLKKEGRHVYLSTRSTEDLKSIATEFGAPPPSFTTNLLNWTKDEFNLDDNHVEAIVTSSKRLCLPSKGCYPDDIGSNCCPF